MREAARKSMLEAAQERLPLPSFAAFLCHFFFFPVFSEEKAVRSSIRREGQMRRFRRQRCSHNFKRRQVVSEGFSTLEQAVRCSAESRREREDRGSHQERIALVPDTSQRRQETKSGKVKVWRATKL